MGENEVILVLVGLAAVALAILFLRLGKRLAIGLLILGGMATVITVALAMLGQASANRETAIAAQQAAQAAQVAAAGQTMTSAATSITLFLVILLLVVVLVIAGVAFAWFWWQKRQRREQYANMLQQAQIYALINGQRASTLRLPPAPQMPAHTPLGMGGPVIVMPGQQSPQYPAYPSSPIASIDDLARALRLAQSAYEVQQASDPFAGLLPPIDDADWNSP